MTGPGEPPKGEGRPYGAGGLGADGAPDPRDAPGVAPDGVRTGASSPSDPPEAATSAGAETRASPVQVATGRQSDAHYEPDPDHIVAARFTTRPQGPLPPELTAAAAENHEPRPGPPIEDVVISPEQRSVWDARPSEPEPAAAKSDR